jgi:hypothetical protein
MYHLGGFFMKSGKLLGIVALATLANIATARSSFNLFFGSPCYYPAPMPLFPAPTPSVGFSMGIPLGDPLDGAPTLGFSVDVPLMQPVVSRRVVHHRPVVITGHEEPLYVETIYTDNEDKCYWRIYNNTDTQITVKSNSATKTIQPGQSGKLDHSSSLILRITDGDQKIRLKTDHHTLAVQFNREGDLKVSKA